MESGDNLTLIGIILIAVGIVDLVIANTIIPKHIKNPVKESIIKNGIYFAVIVMIGLGVAAILRVFPFK